MLSPSDSESKSKSDDYSTEKEVDEEVVDDQFQLDCSEIKVENLGFPSDCKSSSSSSIEIVGSCNGLVCLYDRIDNHVYLWNPSIRGEFKILPKPINIIDDKEFHKFPPRHLVAFGFDVETKDYKVLLLSAYLDSMREDHKPISGQVKCLCQVQVYNLSTDSWRLIEGLHSLPGDPFLYPTTEVLYLNGNCFFLAHFFHTKQLPRFPENDRFIISFDFTKESITPIQLPDHHEDQMLYLRCWGDQMALFTLCPKPTPRGDSYYTAGTGIFPAQLWYADFYSLPLPLETSFGYPKVYRPPQGTFHCMIEGSEDCNIWVLDEQFSSNSSWTKLHSFEIEHEAGERILPSCILNDGEFALLESRDSTYRLVHEMKLYNLVTQELENDFLSCCTFMSKAIAYKPSLVKLTASSSSS